MRNRLRALTTTAIALAALLAFSASAQAQSKGLTAFMTNVANAWEKGDVDAITSLGAKEGIALEVDGTHVGAISAKQAGAVLRRVLEDARTIRASAGASRLLPGADSRAYGEVVWERRSRGTTDAERVTVFFALEREHDAWHITEIRVMR